MDNVIRVKPRVPVEHEQASSGKSHVNHVNAPYSELSQELARPFRRGLTALSWQG